MIALHNPHLPVLASSLGYNRVISLPSLRSDVREISEDRLLPLKVENCMEWYKFCV